MSEQRRRSSRAQRGKANRSEAALDVWRPVGDAPAPTPIAPSSNPTALLDTLGAPPLSSATGVAQHYLAAVVERAAGLATALAASADLLADRAPAADD